MHARAAILLALVAACGSEPLRPMAPELDPASTSAPETEYVPPPNPLEGDVPEGGAAPQQPAEHHDHEGGHHHGGDDP
jgi:hypothetical protein